MRFETKAIRTQTERSQHQEHSTPIFATSGFVFDSPEDMSLIFADEKPGNVYSRYTNPSVREFENKMALLEETEDALATASGMSAIFTTFASLLKAGDHVLMSQAVFGSTIKIMDNFFVHWNVEYDLIDASNFENWEHAIKPNTKIVYIETPSNPGLEIIDISKLAYLCKSHEICFIVDNCFATPYIQQPALLGADIVIHSATKYIDGQGRVMGGVICGSTDYIKKMSPFMRNAGPTLAPFNAWVLSKSLETLALRMDRHSENALQIATWLESHPNVESVNYPFLASFDGYEIATKQMKTGGGMLSFVVKGNEANGTKVLSNISMLSLSANLGDTRTIITHPSSSTHSKLSNKQKQNVGITPNLIRLSVGLEHVEDIKEDLANALDVT